MKNLIIFVAILMPIFCIASIDSIKTNTEITDVTVFFSGAQVTRFENLSLTKGKHLIVLNKLPEEINTRSIQVQKMSNSKILSVKHTLDYSEAGKKSKKERDVEDQIKSEKHKLKKLKIKAQVFEIEEKLLLENNNFSQKEAGASIGEIKEAADYYRLRLNEIRTQKLMLSDQAEDISERILKLYEELNEVTVEKRQAYSRIIIAVECDKMTNSDLKVSYYINSAGWTPHYDFRVESISLPIKIVYNANVYQSSGEDWKNVNIKISANNPRLSGTKPKIVRWYVNQPDPYIADKGKSDGVGSMKGRVFDSETGEPLPFANVSVEKNGKSEGSSTTDFDGLYSIKPVNEGIYVLNVSYVGYQPVEISGVKVIPDQISFQDVEMSSAGGVELDIIAEYSMPMVANDDFNPSGSTIRGSRGSENQTFIDGIKVRGSENKDKSNLSEDYISNTIRTTVANMEYDIDIPYSIPSDGEDYNIKIKEATTPTEYAFYAVPKLEKTAFLTARVANWTELNLISGVTNIFYQGTYVAESYLDVYHSSDTLEISLGRDRNIVVTRKGNKEKRDKRISGNTIKEIVAWDLTIKNNRKSVVKVIVEDQYPLSQLNSIEVELVDAPDAKTDAKTGFLKWEMMLEPDQKKEVSFSYSVKYYKGLKLNLE